MNAVGLEVPPIEDDAALELESFSEERIGLMNLYTTHFNICYNFSMVFLINGVRYEIQK